MTTSPPDWLTAGLDHVWMPYTQMKTAPMPIAVARTEGAHITLADGRVLVDGCASWWTACHGYNHPHIRTAVAAQLETMPHIMMGGLANEQAFRLAARLATLLPGDLDRVFLAESGSVAVEVAMKMAIQYWINRGAVGPATPHKQFIHFDHGYHGDTFATMSVCDVDRGMHHVFKGALPEQLRRPLPTDKAEQERFESFLAAHRGRVAGVIVEPLVQGAGGLKFHDPGTLQFLRAATLRNDALLIFDEIMTGFGRTGSLFACQAADVVPDIITLGKALTGGTSPLSVAVCSRGVAAPFMSDTPDAALMHGPTYMGHAMGCAAANASLDLFEREPRLDQVAAIERHLLQDLAPARQIKGVVDVRVRGAIGAIQVAEMREIEWLRRRFVEAGVFIRPMADVIYVAPPFVVDNGDLRTLTAAMLTVTEEWSRRFGVAFRSGT